MKHLHRDKLVVNRFGSWIQLARAIPDGSSNTSCGVQNPKTFRRC